MLFSTPTNPALARRVAKLSQLKLGNIEIKQFSDGELYVRVKERVRGKNVYILGSTFPPADNLLKLLILANALKTNGAKKITAIVPYFAYARQDWLAKPGAPLTAKLMADLIRCAGINKVITINLHSQAAEKFFKIPVKNIDAIPLLANYFKKALHIVHPVGTEQCSVPTVISPDLGGKERAKRFAKVIGAKNVIALKKFRPKPNVAKILKLDQPELVKNKICIIVDDLIDTAGTIIEAVKLLKRHGAGDIYVTAVHPVFSGLAIKRLKTAPIKQIVVTDTIPLFEEKQLKKIKVLSIVNLITKGI